MISTLKLKLRKLKKWRKILSITSKRWNSSLRMMKRNRKWSKQTTSTKCKSKSNLKKIKNDLNYSKKKFEMRWLERFRLTYFQEEKEKSQFFGKQNKISQSWSKGNHQQRNKIWLQLNKAKRETKRLIRSKFVCERKLFLLTKMLILQNSKHLSVWFLRITQIGSLLRKGLNSLSSILFWRKF